MTPGEATIENLRVRAGGTAGNRMHKLEIAVIDQTNGLRNDDNGLILDGAAARRVHQNAAHDRRGQELPQRSRVPIRPGGQQAARYHPHPGRPALRQPHGRDNRWRCHLYPIFLAEQTIKNGFYSKDVLMGMIRWPRAEL